MESNLLFAIERALSPSDAIVIGEYVEGSYQGEARIIAMSEDGTRVADGSVTWGSCSYCDPWYDMSGEEIAADLDRSVVVLDTPDSIVSYLSKIARPGEQLSWYDRDATIARKALKRWIEDFGNV